MTRRAEPIGLMVAIVAGALVLLYGVVQCGQAGDAESPAQPAPAPGIENLHRLGPSLLAGGQPQGPQAFAALQALGVRTLISVDGAPPDAATARAFGIRTIHLPIGYDTVPRDVQTRLLKAAALDQAGTVFIHCHHGKHRGPAAAAILARAQHGWTPEQARAWLAQAGTARDYGGLYQAVDRFTPIAPDELAAIDPTRDLPEQVEPPDLVERMIEIDRLFEELHDLGRPRPAESPPPSAESVGRWQQSATLLAEQFRELARPLDPAPRRHPDFTGHLTTATIAVTDLATALETARTQPVAKTGNGLATRYQQVATSCQSCHRATRNPTSP